MAHRIFLAGAAGAIGKRLTPMLREAGHTVTGTTRSEAKAEMLRRWGPSRWWSMSSTPRA